MLWRNSSSKSKTRTTWSSFDSPDEREAQQSGTISGQNHQAQQSQFKVRELRTLENLHKVNLTDFVASVFRGPVHVCPISLHVRQQPDGSTACRLGRRGIEGRERWSRGRE